MAPSLISLRGRGRSFSCPLQMQLLCSQGVRKETPNPSTPWLRARKVLEGHCTPHQISLMRSKKKKKEYTPNILLSARCMAMITWLIPLGLIPYLSRYECPSTCPLVSINEALSRQSLSFLFYLQAPNSVAICPTAKPHPFFFLCQQIYIPLYY